MKKLKKTQLKLNKEVISSLTQNDLQSAKGGANFPPQTPVCYTPTQEGPSCNIVVSCANACQETQICASALCKTQVCPVSQEGNCPVFTQYNSCGYVNCPAQ